VTKVTRAAAIELGIQVVKKVAEKLIRRGQHSSIDQDDLESEGMIAMFQMVDRWALLNGFALKKWIARECKTYMLRYIKGMEREPAARPAAKEALDTTAPARSTPVFDPLAARVSTGKRSGPRPARMDLGGSSRRFNSAWACGACSQTVWQKCGEPGCRDWTFIPCADDRGFYQRPVLDCLRLMTGEEYRDYLRQRTPDRPSTGAAVEAFKPHRYTGTVSIYDAPRAALRKNNARSAPEKPSRCLYKGER
jgi:hypothetical protein